MTLTLWGFSPECAWSIHRPRLPVSLYFQTAFVEQVINTAMNFIWKRDIHAGWQERRCIHVHKHSSIQTEFTRWSGTTQKRLRRVSPQRVPQEIKAVIQTSPDWKAGVHVKRPAVRETGQHTQSLFHILQCSSLRHDVKNLNETVNQRHFSLQGPQGW